jgi:hypothetical protein
MLPRRADNHHERRPQRPHPNVRNAALERTEPCRRTSARGTPACTKSGSHSALDAECCLPDSISQSRSVTVRLSTRYSRTLFPRDSPVALGRNHLPPVETITCVIELHTVPLGTLKSYNFAQGPAISSTYT